MEIPNVWTLLQIPIHFLLIKSYYSASNGRFIATCSDKTDLILWNLKGEILTRVDTYHNLTYCVKVGI